MFSPRSKRPARKSRAARSSHERRSRTAARSASRLRRRPGICCAGAACSVDSLCDSCAVAAAQTPRGRTTRTCTGPTRVHIRPRAPGPARIVFCRRPRSRVLFTSWTRPLQMSSFSAQMLSRKRDLTTAPLRGRLESGGHARGNQPRPLHPARHIRTGPRGERVAAAILGIFFCRLRLKLVQATWNKMSGCQSQKVEPLHAFLALPSTATL